MAFLRIGHGHGGPDGSEAGTGAKPRPRCDGKSCRKDDPLAGDEGEIAPFANEARFPKRNLVRLLGDRAKNGVKPSML